MAAVWKKLKLEIAEEADKYQDNEALRSHPRALATLIGEEIDKLEFTQGDLRARNIRISPYTAELHIVTYDMMRQLNTIDLANIIRKLGKLGYTLSSSNIHGLVFDNDQTRNSIEILYNSKDGKLTEYSFMLTAYSLAGTKIVERLARSVGLRTKPLSVNKKPVK